MHTCTPINHRPLLYTPAKNYQWNSKGLINTVQRIKQGLYIVRLPGLNKQGGTVLVTAYGKGPERCNIDNWTQENNDTIVTARCSNTIGQPVDTRYTLSYVSDIGLGMEAQNSEDYGGFIWADKPTELSYTPDRKYQFNTMNSVNTINRSAQGAYRVHFPELNLIGQTNAFVTPYGSGKDHCAIERLESDGNQGTFVYVSCFNTIQGPADSRFTLVFLGSKSFLPDSLKEAESYLAKFNRQERALLQCRIAKLVGARKELTSVALKWGGASESETNRISILLEDWVTARCDGETAQEQLRQMGMVLQQANVRLTSGTIAENNNYLFIDGFGNIMRELNQNCLDSSLIRSGEELVAMSDTEFTGHLGAVSTSGCRRSGGAGGLDGSSVGSSGYGACVQEGLRESIMKSSEPCNGLDRILTPEEQRTLDQARAQEAAARERLERLRQELATTSHSTEDLRLRDSLMDRIRAAERTLEEASLRVSEALEPGVHDRESHDFGVGAEVVGGGIIVGTGVVLGVAIVVATAPISGTALAVAGIVAGIGGAIGLWGLTEESAAETHFVDQVGQRPSWRSCPALNTPSGYLTFASANGDSSSRFTVSDVLRACHCENNPADKFLGGNECKDAEKLKCLREVNDDVPIIDLNCARILKEDNQESLAQKMQACSVINCGTDGMITDSCSCYDLSVKNKT